MHHHTWELLSVWEDILVPQDIHWEGSLCHGRNANLLHRAGDTGLGTKPCLWGELSLTLWHQLGFLTSLHLSSNNKNTHTHTNKYICIVWSNINTHTTYVYLGTYTYVYLSFSFRNESPWSCRCSYDLHVDVRGWEWVENILRQFENHPPDFLWRMIQYLWSFKNGLKELWKTQPQTVLL